jgi:signal peptidase I
MNKMGNIIKVIYGLIIIVLLVIITAMLVSYFGIPNGLRLYTVQSGSMEPAIHVGGVVIDRIAKDYVVGDIISFSPNNNPKNIVTHRIIALKEKNNKLYFLTKGDSNRTPDADIIQGSMILGKVVFSLPLLGYPVAFARTQTGLIVLIIIPATLIIYSEILNIKNEISKIIKNKNEQKNS